jgi:hypothetical protein
MSTELEEKIHKIELQIGVILTHLQNEIGSPHKPGTVLLKLAEMRGDVQQVERMLMGTNGHPGMSVRLDRLEQAHAARIRLEIAGITVLAGLLVKAIWEVLLHVR